MKKSYICLLLILLLVASALITTAFLSHPVSNPFNWGVVVTVMVGLVILAFFFEFEAADTGSKEIALVAMLGTISAAARVPFVAIPGVQPSTFIIICSGYVFGAVAGFMVGAVTALVSNIFLGQGPWTPYQMLAWGLVGVSSALMRNFRLSLIWLIPFGILWGYLYGWIMNTWFWVSFAYPLTFKTFLFYQSTSLWFDTFHAVGNALFLWVFGLKTIRILVRFKIRFHWSLIKKLNNNPRFRWTL
jgi:energy-coupling factor transport system substrate-specific component